MDSRFATAWYLRDWTVFGYRLRPYCLLHSMQLEALGSAVEIGGDISPAELLIAAQVCASNHAVTEFSRVPAGPEEYVFEAELEKWNSYREECCSRPELYERPETSSNGRSLNAPWQQVVVTYLIRQSSIRRMEAWLMPEGQALWDFYSLREQINGDSDILSEQTEAQMAAEAAEHAAKAPERERISKALIWREEQISLGLWPITEKGTWVKFDPTNPQHFPPRG